MEIKVDVLSLQALDHSSPPATAAQLAASSLNTSSIHANVPSVTFSDITHRLKLTFTCREQVLYGGFVIRLLNIQRICKYGLFGAEVKEP